MTIDPFTLWHPVACEFDVPYRHVYQGQLLGRELAIWRADDDFVNVWENRCLHRGVRLSIGTSDGTELRCGYHGWRYANRSAGCTYIPAHPADAPARTICNRIFPVVLRYGLIWTGEEPVGDGPTVDCLTDATPFVLRNLPVDASAELVLKHLRNHRFAPSLRINALVADEGNDAEVTVDEVGDYSITLSARDAEAVTTAVFFVQPVDSARSVIRGVLTESPPPQDQMAVWRHYAHELTELINRINAEAAGLPQPEPMVPTLENLPLRLAELPEPGGGRRAALRVTVGRKWQVSEDIAGFQLDPVSGSLPTFQPGAHIDVHLPNGLVRQYSITNGPGETSYYRIGVKLEPNSAGGSDCLHHSVREGDVLAVSEPRNNFPLRRDSVRTILIAGGIGITPLLSMAQALDRMNLNFDLYCFAQSKNHLAFPDVLEGLRGSVTNHLGLSPEQTQTELQRILAEPHDATNIYICGPGPMLEAARRIAAAAGWPDRSVHFEYFKNTTEINDSSSFEIALARSAITLTVPAGSTILEVLRNHGIPIVSSCEQGACGTCVATVINGEPEHQDVYLNESERRAGQRIMTCVSRARSDRLVLDL